MYRAFTGALALALALATLHWVAPEIAQDLMEVVHKLLTLVSTVLDALAQGLPAR